MNFIICLIAGMLAFSAISRAKIIQPKDTDVLAKVAALGSPREMLKIRQLRMMLQRDPMNLGAAAELGSHYLVMGQRTGKAEYFGMAEAAVSAWAASKDTPADILLIRSAVHRFEHEFDAGLADLNEFLKQNSIRPDVLMSRAILLGVMGRYADAETDCASILTVHHRELSGLCQAQILYFKGKTAPAVALLEPVLTQINGPLYVWAKELQAACFLHDGASAAAIKDLSVLQQQGLLSMDGQLLLVDAMIENKQWAEANLILDALPENLATLLRRTAIQKQTKSGQQWTNRMEEVLSGLTAEEKRKHARELAMYYLVIKENRSEAAKFAEINFSFQKEPIDAKLLVQTLEPVERVKQLEIFKKNGIEVSFSERLF